MIIIISIKDTHMTHEPIVSSEDISRTSYCPLIYIKKTFIALSFNIYYTGEKKEKRKKNY